MNLFRGQGADNITWLWTMSTGHAAAGPAASWWPGASYVTWVGIDGYYGTASATFSNVFAQTINQVRVFTNKPILLSGAGVAKGARQYANINNLFEGMVQYRTLGSGLVVRHREPHSEGLALGGQPGSRSGIPAGCSWAHTRAYLTLLVQRMPPGARQGAATPGPPGTHPPAVP